MLHPLFTSTTITPSYYFLDPNNESLTLAVIVLYKLTIMLVYAIILLFHQEASDLPENNFWGPFSAGGDAGDLQVLGAAMTRGSALLRP